MADEKPVSTEKVETPKKEVPQEPPKQETKPEVKKEEPKPQPKVEPKVEPSKPVVKEPEPKKESYYMRKKKGLVKPNPHTVPEASKKNLGNPKAKVKTEPKTEEPEVEETKVLKPLTPKVNEKAIFYLGVAAGIGAVVFGVYWFFNRKKKPVLPKSQVPELPSGLSDAEIEQMANQIAQEEIAAMAEVPKQIQAPRPGPVPQTEPPLTQKEIEKLQKIEEARKNWE